MFYQLNDRKIGQNDNESQLRLLTVIRIKEAFLRQGTQTFHTNKLPSVELNTGYSGRQTSGVGSIITPPL